MQVAESTRVHDETTIDASGRAPEGPKAFLALMAGDTRELVPLVAGVDMSIGRSRSCHVVIADPEASRLQATLRWESGQMWLTERGSRNGTFVSGKRIEGRVALRPGDVIRVGETRMAVVIERESGSTKDPIVVADPVMKSLVDQVETSARSDASVLLVGETGSGKEVLARRLHSSSERGAGPFVAINCGAIPETLAESVLFGHEKGAFTGATDRRIGVFEASSGGTLFLDEVGELSERMQARLLRVLETGELMRVGSTEPIRVDVRVVSATHRDLESQDGFRPDLFYRLAVVRLSVPPLRERPDDIDALARRFVREIGEGRVRLGEAALEGLRRHAWPGNVRELRNVLEAAIALGESEVLELDDLPLSGMPKGSRLDSHLETVERDRIAAALEACGGNQSAAARRLGISRRALIYRMEKLGLKPPPPSAKS